MRLHTGIMVAAFLGMFGLVTAAGYMLRGSESKHGAVTTHSDGLPARGESRAQRLAEDARPVQSLATQNPIRVLTAVVPARTGCTPNTAGCTPSTDPTAGLTTPPTTGPAAGPTNEPTRTPATQVATQRPAGATTTPTPVVTPRPTQMPTATPTPMPVPSSTVRPTQTPVPTPAASTPVATVTPVATATPPPTPTPLVTATPTATATVSPTPTLPPPPAVTRTVVPTVPPTPVPTQTSTPSVPQVRGAFSGQFQSGSQRLMVGRTTRIVVRYTVTNDSNEMVDLSHTVVFDLADGVTALSAVPTMGDATLLPRRVSWGGFVLNPSESATIEMTLEVTPAPTTAGRTIVLITGVHITGVTASGGIITQRGSGLTSGLISGLANGGFVAALTATGVNGGVPVLPNTGAGETSRRTSSWVLLVFTLLSVFTFPLKAMLRRMAR